LKPQRLFLYVALAYYFQGYVVSAFWMIASGVGGIAAAFALGFAALQYFGDRNGPQQTEQSGQMNRAGDLVIRGGDGGPAGKGGDVHVGPGIYKAGDAVQLNRSR
jgi:hypothetical protein